MWMICVFVSCVSADVVCFACVFHTHMDYQVLSSFMYARCGFGCKTEPVQRRSQSNNKRQTNNQQRIINAGVFVLLIVVRYIELDSDI